MAKNGQFESKIEANAIFGIDIPSYFSHLCNIVPKSLKNCKEILLAVLLLQGTVSRKAIKLCSVILFFSYHKQHILFTNFMLLCEHLSYFCITDFFASALKFSTQA
jgi:hypothetical protein